MAQELKAHNFNLFYFNSKKQGELDFVIKLDDEIVPIEVKSGKDYERHNALKNVLANPDYDIKKRMYSVMIILKKLVKLHTFRFI